MILPDCLTGVVHAGIECRYIGTRLLPTGKAYCLLELAERLESRVMPMALLQLGNISRVQTRLGSKTETKSSEIFVEDY